MAEGRQWWRRHISSETIIKYHVESAGEVMAGEARTILVVTSTERLDREQLRLAERAPAAEVLLIGSAADLANLTYELSKSLLQQGITTPQILNVIIEAAIEDAGSHDAF